MELTVGPSSIVSGGRGKVVDRGSAEALRASQLGRKVGPSRDGDLQLERQQEGGMLGSWPDAELLRLLVKVDVEMARQVQAAGCAQCGGRLDRGDYRRKPRGELGEAAGGYERRQSFCCRVDGCRKRATPPSVRFLGRKVYIGVLVVMASMAGRAMKLEEKRRARQTLGVPARTVRRWLGWWQTVFALSPFFTRAKAFFATPVQVSELPGSLLSRFAPTGTASLAKMLRFLSPITTESVEAGIAMGA